MIRATRSKLHASRSSTLLLFKISLKNREVKFEVNQRAWEVKWKQDNFAWG